MGKYSNKSTGHGLVYRAFRWTLHPLLNIKLLMLIVWNFFLFYRSGNEVSEAAYFLNMYKR